MAGFDLSRRRFSGIRGPGSGVVTGDVIWVRPGDGRGVTGHVELRSGGLEVSVSARGACAMSPGHSGVRGGGVKRGPSPTSSRTAMPLSPAYLTTCRTSSREYVSFAE